MIFFTLKGREVTLLSYPHVEAYLMDAVRESYIDVYEGIY